MEKIPKEDIAALPMFPEHKRIKDFEVMTFISCINTHLDLGHAVAVYKVPVVTSYPYKRGYRKYLLSHLKECLVVSKYMKSTPGILCDYLLVTEIKKLDPDFEYKLFRQYP